MFCCRCGPNVSLATLSLPICHIVGQHDMAKCSHVLTIGAGSHGDGSMQIDREQWDLEYQQVAPRLQIRVAAEARDWRTHLDAASEQLLRTFPEESSLHAATGMVSTHFEGVGSGSIPAWPQTKKHLQQVQAEVAEQLTKIETREQFLNNELTSRTDEYRNKKQIHEHKQVWL
jgi:hypothetical protein